MNVENLSLEFSTQVIFNNISFRINDNDKVGIIGVNGAGKSTLFKVIMKELEPTSGKIIMKKNARIGFLPQVITDNIDDANIKVLDYLLLGRPIKKLEEELTSLYIEASLEKNDFYLDKILKKIGQTQGLLEYWEQYEAENILLKIIYGMNITDEMLDLTIKELSGGQKSKVAFARLLYSKPEILLLDEPTNHLDQESKDYITDYLKKYKGTILVISHDTQFLDSVTNSTLYLNKNTHLVELFPGNYRKYLKIKEEREASQLKLLDKQEKEEEKLKKIIAKYIGGNEKKANIAKDRQKKLAKLENDKVVIEKKIKTAKFKIKMDYPSGIMPLKVTNLGFGYSDKLIIKNLTFSLARGEKFLIVGENGVGKSTLLKLIINQLNPVLGNIEIGYKTKIAYYAQEHELLKNNLSIVDNFCDSGLSNSELRSVLGSFLFNGDDIYKKINVLSPGERSRVALAKISILGANFMILDEPTNHLDPDTQRIIAETFNSFEGTMLVVSHNIEFIENLGIERMLLLPSGEIKYYDRNIVKYYHELNQKK